MQLKYRFSKIMNHYHRFVVIVHLAAYKSGKEGIAVVGLWLTTIGAMTIFFAMLYFFFIFIRSSVNSEDSIRVDKLPEKDSSS
jgi:hypothetical protein